MGTQVVHIYATEYYSATEILKHYADTKHYQLKTIVWHSKKDRHNFTDKNHISCCLKVRVGWGNHWKRSQMDFLWLWKCLGVHCGSDYMHVYICQTSWNVCLRWVHFMYVNLPWKLIKTHMENDNLAADLFIRIWNNIKFDLIIYSKHTYTQS